MAKELSEEIVEKIEDYKLKKNKLVPVLKSVLVGDEYKQYAQYNKHDCGVCNSPYRDEVEKLFIELRQVNPIKKFLNQKNIENGIKPKWWWASIDTHFKEHCDFTPISIDYIKQIIDTREEYEEIEMEPIGYGRRMCLGMIREMKSLDLSKQLDRMIEVNKVVNSILATYKSFTSLEYEISGLRKEADDAIADMANKFTEVMTHLLEAVKGQENKEAVIDSIKDFQAFLKLKIEGKK